MGSCYAMDLCLLLGVTENYLGGDIKRQIIELSNFCWLTRHQSLFDLGGLQQARF